MTTLNSTEITCAVCGQPSEHLLLGSTATLGPPDFDTRPAPLMRDTIWHWVMACPQCGYAAPYIGEAVPEAVPIVRSESYRALRSDASVPDKAAHFLCYAHLLDRLGVHADAGWAALHAAWICDDSGQPDAAHRCRARAVELWRKAKKLGQNYSDETYTEFALVTDVLRRIGDFDHAVEACREGLDEKDIPPAVEAMLRRQLVLIQQKDTACHSMSELPESPDGAVPVTLH
jgi:uncharacterized protein (DUF2225 family)